MAPKYTHSAQQSLQQAQSEAIRRDHQELLVEHLLYALVGGGDQDDDDESIIPNILKLAGVSLTDLKAQLNTLLERLPKVTGGSGQIFTSSGLTRLLVLAEEEAKKLKDEYISGEHFLLAALSSRSADAGAAKALTAQGMTREALLAAIQKTRGGAKIQDPEPKGKYRALEKYCRDLTQLAQNQKLDPVIGRDEEIRLSGPGPFPANEKQPGPDRRTGGR